MNISNISNNIFYKLILCKYAIFSYVLKYWKATEIDESKVERINDFVHNICSKDAQKMYFSFLYCKKQIKEALRTQHETKRINDILFPVTNLEGRFKWK